MSAEEDEIVAGEQETVVVDEGAKKQEPPAETNDAEEIEAGAENKVVTAEAMPRLTITGYADIGFFFAQNHGAGFIKDVNDVSGLGKNAAAVFLGDYASTYINSRHDMADQGDASGFMADPIDSNGNPTFLINSLYLKLIRDFSESFRFEAAIAAAPRARSYGQSLFELDIAHLDYRPFSGLDVTLSLGKFDAITGIEYRWRHAPDRWTVTPSLTGRYTDGTPVGVKVRGKHFDKRFIYNLALTNGSNFVNFTHLNDDIDSNQMKTVSSRLSYDFRFGPIPLLELGVSGEYGPQSNQRSNNVIQRTGGIDLQVAWSYFEMRGQYLNILLEGGGPDEAKRYSGWGGYGEILFHPPWNPLSWIDWGIYGRFGRRDLIEQDSKYIFVIDTYRITGGIRIEPTDFLTLKAEYVHNIEGKSLTPFDNDVFTSSVVVVF